VHEAAKEELWNGGELDLLCSAIDPEGQMDRHDWDAFWEEIGHKNPTDTFADAFIIGAAEVYDEIADQL
jgi:hypothetical protein